MQDKIAVKPVNSDSTVVVIDDADSLTIESQNALLKTLEEPPKYITMILIVSDEQKLLETIKSRCIKINFADLTNEELNNYLDEHKINNYNQKVAIKLLDGSLKNIDELDKVIELYDNLQDLTKTIKGGSVIDLYKSREILYSKKDDIFYILDLLNIIFFEKQMIDCIEIVEKVRKKILNNNNYEMSIDYLLMNCYKNYNNII